MAEGGTASRDEMVAAAAQMLGLSVEPLTSGELQARIGKFKQMMSTVERADEDG